MWMESKFEGVGHISTTLGLSLTFPNYEFGKGQYAFYPMKLSRFLPNPETSTLLCAL